MSREVKLPTELIKWDYLPFTQQQTRIEYSSACPLCGDAGHIGNDLPDRWRMIHEGDRSRGFCRRCGHFEWANQGSTMTPEQIKAAEEERRRFARIESLRMQAKINLLRKQELWRFFHEQMTEEQRKRWRAEGIADSLQDFYTLGYAEQQTFGSNDGIFQTDAMTIPFFDMGHALINMQYRLVDYSGSGKYRFSQGIPAPVFRTDPDNPIRGRTLVIEGAKKAIVVAAYLYAEWDAIVGVPSKYVSKLQADTLADCDKVVLALDPDANWDGLAKQAAKMIGPERCFIATLPAKPDDCIVEYGMDPKMLNEFFKQARPA